MKRLLLIALIVAVALAGVLPAGVVAQESTPTPNGTDTPTPTPTPTPEPTQTASDGGDGGSDTGDDANSGATAPLDPDLYVEQPRHVDQPVETTTEGGVPVVRVRGRVLELSPGVFNQSQVLRAGIREDGATLTYDGGIDRWVLDTQGTAGSYRVFWVVRTDGDERVYAATIQVEPAQFEHLAPGALEDLRGDAGRYETVRDIFEPIVATSAGFEQFESVAEDAVTWYQFYLNPLQALTGQFISIGILLIKWPAGWIIFAVLLLSFFIYDRKKTKENRKLKRQFANIENIDESERRAWERELKRSLAMKTFEDLGLTTSDAQAIREHFDITNPRQFLDELRGWLDETGWARIILGAHHQRGDQIAIERDEEDTVTGAVVVAGEEPALPDGGDGNVELVAPDSAAVTDEVVQALDWGTLDPQVLWADDVRAGDLDLPVANGPAEDGTDLVDAFDVPIGEDGHEMALIERREEFVNILITVIEHIAASQYCDDEGRPRAEVDMIDFLFTFASVGSEKYRWPLHNTKDILLRTLQRLDADERMDDLASRSRDGDL